VCLNFAQNLVDSGVAGRTEQDFVRFGRHVAVVQEGLGDAGLTVSLRG